MKKVMKITSLLALLLGIFVLPAEVVAIPFGQYVLGSHPDGNKTPPKYGLRLDQLLGSGTGVWTFDFDHTDSAMSMDYSNQNIHIFGTTFGGKDIGSSYEGGTTALWAIDFTYKTGTFNEVANGGIVDTKVEGGHQNFGTITNLSAITGRAINTTSDLRDHGKGGGGTSGLAIQLGDENGSFPWHREFNGISGWGWLDHKLDPGAGWPGTPTHTGLPSDSGCCSDWLFTATPVPEPSTILLLGSGIVGLFGWQLHKKKQSV